MKTRIFILLIALCCTPLWAQQVVNVDHVAYTVSDLDEGIAFLEVNVEAQLIEETNIGDPEIALLFGLESKYLPIQIAHLRLGEEQIQLLQFNNSDGREIPHDSKSNDLWFQHMAIVVNDMTRAYQKVHQNKVEHVSTAPQTLPDFIPAAAGISAFYFRDMDDHNLELIYFPKGKGNPKWQFSSETHFLGIDHTAIGISDTDKSLMFYRDVLGLKVAGNSENYGSEQEHLNQVFGARLLITGLHADEGFGVEFLQYIAPPGGRPYPDDSTPLDLWHWHTTMQVDDLEGMVKKLRQENVTIVSSGIQPIKKLGWSRAILVRDPDGHAILLYEK